MDVQRIADGLWRWTTPHPEWDPVTVDGLDPAYRDVGCVYVEAPGAIVLVDPLVPSDPGDAARFHRALDADVRRTGLPVAVVLTTHFHVRSAARLAERHEGRVFVARSFADLAAVPGAQPVEPGDPLPGGVEMLATSRPGQVAVWIPGHRALAFGDVVLGDLAGGLRLLPQEWLSDGADGLVGLRRSLRPLLDLPVERVLPAHGDPVLSAGREALAAALA